jgi:cellulose synthase (UDP-forming)
MNTITIAIGCWGISTRRGDQYYISSFWYMLLSWISVIRGKKVKFNVTPKDKQIGRNLSHILPHIVIIGLCVIGILYNLALLLAGKHPQPAGFAANAFWTFINIGSLSIMIRAAFYKPVESEE